MRESCRLEALSLPGVGSFRWVLRGHVGARFLIEASSDLQTWTPLTTVTNSDGRAEFADPDWARFRQRFYRGTRID